ncbi:DUF4832 domain-containing protein [Photobacterium kishitanii]|uniref:DUF4832 domain-containing protein n=2 Tax=Photobacterium kishitanii TaxID=318456 RepID=UPI0009BB82E8|nr:DUF4832 domain-containing protein [Photobacterium kishitanii]
MDLSGYAAKTSNSVGLVDNGYTLHNLEPYIAALVHAFPHTPKTMLGTDKGDFLSYATNRGFGWRVDCLGDWSKGWSEMEDGYPGLIAHASDIQTNTAPDVLFDQRWKKSAVDFEICQDSLQDWSNIKNPLHLTYDQVQQTFDFALKEHASLIDAKSHQIPNIYQPLLTAFLNKLGYRYQLNEVDYSRNIPKNGTLTINSQWQNLGVAPSYINYPVTWRLRTANGSIIAYHTSNAKIENWFPAADYEDQSPIYKVSDHFQLGNQISKGQYFLDVGLVEKGTYNAKVLLANDTKMTTDTGQSYTINNNVIKNNNSIVSYVDNNHYLYNGNVKYPSSFFFDKHSEQYIKQQNNIGRWNEIATINVI